MSPNDRRNFGERLIRLTLPFGAAALAWNGWLALQLATGDEPVRPLPVIRIVLGVVGGIALVAIGAAYRRHR